MGKLIKNILFVALASITLFGCKTTKKKGELSWLSKAYQNTTARYNGYYNAEVIIDESVLSLQNQHQDNYNEILDIYPHEAANNPKAVAGELDRAIEKVTTVVALHEPSHWVDDCYVVMGKAQYLKQDYESAEETFKYFSDAFSPSNPGSRLYKSSGKKLTDRDKKREEAKEERAKKAEEREITEQARKESRKEDETIKKERDSRQKIEKEEETKQKEELRKLDEKDKKKTDELREKKKKVRSSYQDKAKKLRDDINNEKKKLASEQKRYREQQVKERRRRGTNNKRDKKTDADNINPKEVQLKASIENKNAQLDGLDALEDAEVKQIDDQVDKIDADRAARKANAATDREKRIQAKLDRKAEEEAYDAEQEQKAEEELQALIEKQNKKEDQKKVINKGKPKKGLFKHQPAYPEGMFWLAKTYIARNNWGTAEYLINNLEENVDTPRDIAKKLPAVKADLFIQKQDYDNAIPALEVAMDVAKRKEKGRYAYIVAQLYEKNNDPASAYRAYDKAASMAKDYEMKLNANLSKIRTGWASKTLSMGQAEKQIKRLRKDDKNEEYIGQIYFTLAEIKLADGDTAGAQEAFQKALDEGATDKAQKGNSYFRLANLYYLSEDYIPALSFYDSTLMVINQKDEIYPEARSKSNDLKEISRQLKLVNRQDSLLGLSKLSKEELREIAERIIKEKRANEAEGPELNPDDPEPTQSGLSTALGSSNSNFFAYNRLVVEKGKVDFKRRWGDRQVQDNWRRGEALRDIEQQDVAIETNNEKDDNLDDDLLNGEINNALRDVPQSEAQIASANTKIETAMFALGGLYRANLQNYEKSNTVLNDLLTRYPNTGKKLDSYYLIYLNHLDLDNNGAANTMKQKIVSEFPDSEFAKILSDDNYVHQAQKDAQKLEDHYAGTYNSFSQGSYDAVIQRSAESKDLFGKGNAYAAKYDLLGTMSIGYTKGKDDYLVALKDFVNRHPNTPEQTRANEIIRFLKGDEEAFDGRLYEEDTADFSIEDDKLHYVIVVTYDLNQTDLDDFKIAITKFNDNFFKLDKLRLSNIYLNAENKTQIILIRKFSNKKKAMTYVDTIDKNQDDFMSKETKEYEYYAVTSRNYREIMKQKTIRNYRQFFENNYKK